MDQVEQVNTEVKTKALYRGIATVSWGLFLIFLVLWVFSVIDGLRAVGGLGVSGVLAAGFTVLTAKKKIQSEAP
ncbi:MAG: hypothetical protein WC495_04240 [Patescibacteria group bacterium]|jgi:hypothetical protein